MTPTEYADTVTARFGRLPSWPELAKRESALMRMRFGTPPQPPKESVVRAYELQRERAAQRDAVDAAVLAALTTPMPRMAIVVSTGLYLNTVETSLRRMEREGKIARRRQSGLSMWRPA